MTPILIPVSIPISIPAKVTILIPAFPSDLIPIMIPIPKSLKISVIPESELPIFAPFMQFHPLIKKPYTCMISMHVRGWESDFCNEWECTINLIAHELKYLQLRMNGVFKDPNVIPSANWCIDIYMKPIKKDTDDFMLPGSIHAQ